jgi:hypothetical protein
MCYTKIMSVSHSDTDPQMDALQVRLLREVPAWRKLDMLAQLNKSACLLALSGLRQRYPRAKDGELHRRLAALLLARNWRAKSMGT